MRRGPEPRPLPSPYPETPFRTSDGVAGARRLRAADLDSSVWGVRARTGASAELETRCRMFAVRMPTFAFFSHGTAARLLGAPLPLRLDRERELHISVPTEKRSPHAAGIRGHHVTLVPGDVVDRHGLRVASPARVWCDLAAVLSLPDLVALGDRLIHRRLPLATREELAQRAALLGRRRGSRRAVEAIALLSDRAESRPESHLRVLFVTSGLPAPEINHVVVATDAGPDMRTDLAFRALKFAVEYQGDYHRSREQWRKDLTRRARLEEDGWYILEVSAADLRTPEELIARVRRILARRARERPPRG